MWCQPYMLTSLVYAHGTLIPHFILILETYCAHIWVRRHLTITYATSTLSLCSDGNVNSGQISSDSLKKSFSIQTPAYDFTIQTKSVRDILTAFIILVL